MPNNSNMQLLERKQLSAFIVFDRIIKDPDFSIIRKYGVMDEFSKYLDTDKIKTLSDEALRLELLTRTVENPLEYFKIADFNTEKNYKSLYDNYERLYIDSPELRMFNSISSYISSGYMSNVYVWNPIDDKRQRYELYKAFRNDSVLKYITGPFDKAVSEIKPSLIYDWSAERIDELLDTEEWDSTFFLLADYGFNYIISDTGFHKLKYNLGNRNNVVPFPSYKDGTISEIKG